MGRYDIFQQMLADGQIDVNEYAHLVNLTANAEARVNQSFSSDSSEGMVHDTSDDKSEAKRPRK